MPLNVAVITYNYDNRHTVRCALSSFGVLMRLLESRNFL